MPHSTPVVDIHAHLFPPGLPDLATSTGDDRWPVLDRAGDQASVLVRGAAVRRAGRVLWDVPARVAALDTAGIDLQVVSPVPVALVPWAPAGPAARWCAALNDGLATAVAGSGGRLAGLGALPLGPGPDAVAAGIVEARRIRARGLVGAELPTLPGGREYDDPELDPFWAAVAELELPLFVHPTDAGAVRRGDPLHQFGIGMLADTALAATALIFGGVLERHPGLRIALAHGCGALPWTFPRSRFMAAATFGFDPGRADRLLRGLWADTLVFDPEHLRLLARCFGPEHLLLGTDDPLVPGRLAAAAGDVGAAVASGALADGDHAGVLGANALTFLGLSAPAPAL